MTETVKDIAVREAMMLLRGSFIIEPMLTAHLEELHMDTPEDEALLDDIRTAYNQWATTVRALRAAVDDLEGSLG